ncbi:hypothetical protein BKA81DRAFT_369140 [Phyllosticta paracitricarpa]
MHSSTVRLRQKKMMSLASLGSSNKGYIQRQVHTLARHQKILEKQTLLRDSHMLSQGASKRLQVDAQPAS